MQVFHFIISPINLDIVQYNELDLTCEYPVVHSLEIQRLLDFESLQKGEKKVGTPNIINWKMGKGPHHSNGADRYAKLGTPLKTIEILSDILVISSPSRHVA